MYPKLGKESNTSLKGHLIIVPQLMLLKPSHPYPRVYDALARFLIERLGRAIVNEIYEG